MPLAVSTLVSVGCRPETAQRHFPHLVNAMLANEITTGRRGRAFLSQALHESGLLRWMEEIWGPNKWQLTYDGRMGNVKRGDGYRYRGRGPFMLTGRSNYHSYEGKLSRPFERNPDLVAEPRDGWLVAARYWTDKGLNPFADRQDMREITRRINGAATDGPPSHFAQRMAIYNRLPADCTPVRPDPYRILTREERDTAEALEMERRSARRNGGWDKIGPEHLAHATQLKANLVERRKGIYRVAENEPNGWDVKRRRARYALLQQLTK